MKQLDKALEELRGLRRDATRRPLTPSPGTQDDPMDVDTDENAHVSLASPSAQGNVHALQRVPAYVYKVPCIPSRTRLTQTCSVSDISALPKTPNRHPSTHSLLTPPPTGEHNPRRLARTSVSLSYRDFEEQADGRPMDASGQLQAHGAPSEASGSHTQLVHHIIGSVCVCSRRVDHLRRRAVFHRPQLSTPAKSRSPTSSGGLLDWRSRQLARFVSAMLHGRETDVSLAWVPGV